MTRKFSQSERIVLYVHVQNDPRSLTNKGIQIKNCTDFSKSSICLNFALLHCSAFFFFFLVYQLNGELRYI